MDDTDRKLLKLICTNPRMHLNELAKRLGISTQAVHHRLQMLMKTGALYDSTAGISVQYLGAIPIALFGRFDMTPVDGILDRLGESEFTRAAVVAGSNHLFVCAELRNISDLEGYVGFVRRAAKMSEPTVGIYSLDDGLCFGFPIDGATKLKQGHRELTLLDLRIVHSLKNDVRRPIADIAHEVRATPKTVRRHLEKMISDGLIALDVRGTSGGRDVEVLAHVSLKDNADKGEVGRRLISRYPIHVACIRSFSNLPRTLLCVFYANGLSEILKILKEVGTDPDVVAVVPNVTCAYRVYETWRDRLPEDLIASAKRVRAR